MNEIEIKVRVEKEKNRHFEIRRFFVNNHLVCECEIGADYYCTVNRNGNPSNIRTKWKKTYSTRWMLGNIGSIIGNSEFITEDFKNDRPDLTWGY